MMKLIDFIIIYLACGAPFGVYFFIQQRETIKNTKLWQNSSLLWLKCVFITLFWIPFAIQLLQSGITKKLRNIDFAQKKQSDSISKRIEEFEKSFSQILLETKTDIPLFDFREVFERYVGLTRSKSLQIDELPEDVNELYSIGSHENPALATICLNRRNRLRLERHQTFARKDFLRIIEKINSNKKVSTLATEFANLINDVELTAELNKIFHESAQIDKVLTVKKSEDSLWNPIELKQLPAKEKSLNLPTISATATMLKHD